MNSLPTSVRRERMVRWLSPSGLFSTALDVVISGIFAKYADKREIEGLFDKETIEPITGDSVWIDYVADLGDGWNSTYTIASLLAQDPATINTPDSPMKGTERGRILVLGGDEVYPKASPVGYEARLLGPYRAATAGEQPGPRSVYAIPGNHDWYDGLTSFMRVFCRNRRFATWKAPQKRSYFALRLPHDWWLLGIDIAFDSYIDEAQLAFFRDVHCRNDDELHSPDACIPVGHCGDETKMHCGDKIILCTAKPGWEEAFLTGDFHTIGQVLGRRALHEFETEITKRADLVNEEGERDGWGCKLRLVLSGDLHHYARYDSGQAHEPQRITAGGGGAFFFPTHSTAPRISWPSEGPDGVTYERKSTFPEPEVSKRWRWLIPLAPIFANPSFAFTVGFIYLLLGMLAPQGLQPPIVHGADPTPTIAEAARLHQFWQFWFPPTARPLFVIFAVLILMALLAFADAKTKPGRIVLMAFPHWLTHMYALTFALVMSRTLAAYWLPGPAANDGAGQLWFVGVAALLLMFGGGLMGGFVMGFYLLIAQLFGRHPGEAFAAMHMSSYKNFLRIRLDEHGLTVYPFGVRRVCKRWRCEEGQLTPRKDPSVELIERPITIS